MAKPTVGLTGGIASGKSAVARRFRDKGVPVIDADQLAREVVAPGSDGLAAIVEAFGPQYVGADGALDRKKLGALVFEDEAKRKQLESITHPRIALLAQQKIGALQDHAAPFLVYEAPLLVEIGLHRAFTKLVVVALDAETQLARLMARDGSTREEAAARIASQLPLAEKVAVADHVIDNGGTPDETDARFEEVYAALVAEF